MNDTIAIAALAYLLVGLLLGTLGPGGQDIAQELERARGTPLSNAAMERVPPSELKLLWFRIAITVAFALLWPIFTYGILKEHSLFLLPDCALGCCGGWLRTASGSLRRQMRHGDRTSQWSLTENL